MQLLRDYHTASVWLFWLNSWIHMNPSCISIWTPPLLLLPSAPSRPSWMCHICVCLVVFSLFLQKCVLTVRRKHYPKKAQPACFSNNEALKKRISAYFCWCGLKKIKNSNVFQKFYSKVVCLCVVDFSVYCCGQVTTAKCHRNLNLFQIDDDDQAFFIFFFVVNLHILSILLWSLRYCQLISISEKKKVLLHSLWIQKWCNTYVSRWQ